MSSTHDVGFQQTLQVLEAVIKVVMDLSVRLAQDDSRATLEGSMGEPQDKK